MSGVGSLFDLTGLTAVVTGANRGLGRGFATGLARAGATVVVAGRRADASETAAREIAESTGAEVVGIPCDVGDWGACARLLGTVYDKFGKCDVLVNNAGISQGVSEVTSVTEELWDRIHSTNLKGTFRLSTLFGERMMAAGSGSIINIGSSSAQSPGKDTLAYAVSKGGLDSLTLGLANIYGPRVRVNAIYPNAIDSDTVRSWPGLADYLVTSGREKPGDPEDLVGAVVFLAGAGSRFVSGARIPVS